MMVKFDENQIFEKPENIFMLREQRLKKLADAVCEKGFWTIFVYFFRWFTCNDAAF